MVRVGQAGLQGSPQGPKAPVFFGECGIPMDMNEHRAFDSGDYSLHVLALDAMMSAMEQHKVASFTLWNYFPKNRMDVGDIWNGEDFSIFSQSIYSNLARKAQIQHCDLRDLSLAELPDSETKEAVHHRLGSSYIGGRALEAIIRPYAAFVAGKVVRSHFDYRKKTYRLEFESIPGVRSTETEIYLPDYHFHIPVTFKDWKDALDIRVSGGNVQVNADQQRVLFTTAVNTGSHWIEVRARHAFLPNDKLHKSKPHDTGEESEELAIQKTCLCGLRSCGATYQPVPSAE